MQGLMQEACSLYQIVPLQFTIINGVPQETLPSSIVNG
jgi:hypothetical protein